MTSISLTSLEDSTSFLLKDMFIFRSRFIAPGRKRHLSWCTFWKCYAIDCLGAYFPHTEPKQSSELNVHATCANWQIPVPACTTGRLHFDFSNTIPLSKSTKLLPNTTICRHFVASAKPKDNRYGKTKSPSKWLKNQMSTSPRSMSAPVGSWEGWNFCLCLRSEAARTRLIWRRNQKWGWSTMELRSP